MTVKMTLSEVLSEIESHAKHGVGVGRKGDYEPTAPIYVYDCEKCAFKWAIADREFEPDGTNLYPCAMCGEKCELDKDLSG